jgi:hypothetical protein
MSDSHSLTRTSVPSFWGNDSRQLTAHRRHPPFRRQAISRREAIRVVSLCHLHVGCGHRDPGVSHNRIVAFLSDQWPTLRGCYENRDTPSSTMASL